jgi:hypothetical protein
VKDDIPVAHLVEECRARNPARLALLEVPKLAAEVAAVGEFHPKALIHAAVPPGDIVS